MNPQTRKLRHELQRYVQNLKYGCVDPGGSERGSHGEELLVKLAINEDEVIVVIGSTIDVIGNYQHEEKSKLIVVGGHFDPATFLFFLVYSFQSSEIFMKINLS